MKKSDDHYSVYATLTNFQFRFHPLRDNDNDMSLVTKKKVHAVGITTFKRKLTALIRLK